MSLEVITELSQRYGADADFVLAGGGNTSYKTETDLYVKPSGVSLADIQEDDFIKMDRAKVRAVFETEEFDDKAMREAVVKKQMLDAVAIGVEGRPSVEAPLHEVMKFTYVVHLHPALVNGMTCGKNGKAGAAELFPEALWVDYVDPGFTLAKAVKDEVAAYEAANSKQPSVIFLQNHGVFVGADSKEAIEQQYENIMEILQDHYEKQGVFTDLRLTGVLDKDAIKSTAPKLRTILGTDGNRKAVTSSEFFDVAQGPLSPDHIVYAKSFALSCDEICKDCVNAFEAEKGYKPLVVSVPSKVVFCAGDTYKDAKTVLTLAKDAALVQQLAEAFGGPAYLSEAHYGFIENWEVESYRKKVAAGGAAGRLNGKVAVVTGGAQGFGYGIAEGLLKEGAVVAIADLNIDGATKVANEFCDRYGAYKAFPVCVNIADEESVNLMTEEVVCRCGGLDLFVANAGVLKAGSVKELSKKDWDFVTNVNYSGYFLCVKSVAPVMALQNAEGGDWTDIVQINSKSGLQGSNRNGAYAGSKFGSLGLTQSFAMELVEDKIKVNSICQGNFFEGPLWSDPERGLFVQYLNSGKVPGAKTLEDVKRFYESKIPMNRGCTPEDVVRGIIYAVEQKYETGQAIPITGGQVMLN
jgi:NAD(P)-dependent dehydrogenase (short-subunit alcohol dehydrogenase family)/rhamnose utilization protein RhaD (predicted bifunctional aldolase and dehydrogenase)